MKTDGVSLAFFSFYTKHQKCSEFGIIFRVFLYCTILHLKSYTFPPKTHTKRAWRVRETATCWIFLYYGNISGAKPTLLDYISRTTIIAWDSRWFIAISFHYPKPFFASLRIRKRSVIKAFLNAPNQRYIESFQSKSYWQVLQ